MNRIMVGIDNEPIKENKNYYMNLLIKKRVNNNNVGGTYSIACVVSLSNCKINIICRYYKVSSFTNNIPLDYINIILTKKFPLGIIDNILNSYLNNDVSFKSIQECENSKGISNNIFTLKIESTIHFCEKEKSNKIHNGNICLKSILFKDAYELSCNFSKKLKKYLDLNDYFHINEIFNLDDDDDIEYCNIHKIINAGIAWGIIL